MILFLNNLCQGRVEEIVKQAGAELGQAQLKPGLYFNSINLNDTYCTSLDVRVGG